MGQVIAVTVRCFDSEDTATAQVTAPASSEFSVVLPTPTLINPFSNYITTSNLLRVKSSSHAPAVEYEWQIRQSGMVVATSSASSPETVVELPFPPASFGIFEARTRYRDVSDVYSEYSSWVEFTIKDRSTGSLAYAQDFTTLSLCGDKMVMIAAGCSGVHILGTYPSCDSTGWFGGGGNVWICNTGFEETNVLQINNSNMNSLSFYSGFYDSINATHVSYEVEAFQHGTAEDAAATVVTCRAYPADGNDGFTFVVYPYRTSGVNVEIRERRFSTNTYNVLASAYRSEAYLATGPARTWLRFDCLGSSFTGYYRNSSGKWFPLVVAHSTFAASSPHRIGMGTGQGNQFIKLRIYGINVRELSL